MGRQPPFLRSLSLQVVLRTVSLSCKVAKFFLDTVANVAPALLTLNAGATWTANQLAAQETILSILCFFYLTKIILTKTLQKSTLYQRGQQLEQTYRSVSSHS